MSLDLLETKELRDRFYEVVMDWANGNGGFRLFVPANEHASMLRRRLVAGADLPTVPTAAQARKGLTAEHLVALRPLLLEAVDRYLHEVAVSLVALAPVFSADAQQLLDA